jgi:nucleotide-binding universal stress UspA family protein
MQLPNVQIRKILYATDLSENAVHALAYAVSLAGTYGASMTTLHVVTEFSGEEFATNMISRDTLQAIKERHYSEARAQLIGKKRDKIAIKEVIQAFYQETLADDTNSSQMTDEILIKSGAPAEVIVQTAQALNCDLIVMGTHGQSVISDILVGSTAKWVLKHSFIPVLVIRLPEA